MINQFRRFLSLPAFVAGFLFIFLGLVISGAENNKVVDEFIKSVMRKIQHYG